MAIIRTTSELNPEDHQLLNVALHKKDLFHQGKFIAEGERVVTRLLASNVATLKVLTTEEKFSKHKEIFNNPHFEHTEITVASKEEIESIVGYGIHQAIVAIGVVPIDSSPDVLFNNKSSASIILALDHVINADNVGGIVRNCSAFGVDLVIAGESSSSPYYRRAIRNSMGTVFNQKVFHTDDLKSTLNELKDTFGFKIIGAHPIGAKPLNETEIKDNICIVLGNEEEGISENILSICDKVISIPMRNNTDSLNVANAAAVFLYEIRRQGNL